jgi:hypothetical protein
VGGVRAARRAATRHYTYGYGRVEDLAGLFIVTMIALSAVLAGYESIRQPTTTDLLPTSMATIGIMPIVCIRTPNSSPPAKPPTPLTYRPTIVKGWAWPARLATTPPSVRATSILGGQVRRYGGDHALFGDGDHITDDR